jgi:arabinose-5-phosphate isomerase
MVNAALHQITHRSKGWIMTQTNIAWVASARRALKTEADGLDQLVEALDGPLATPVSEAIRLISAAQGRVIVSGIGKSGHIARKIASTMASTGTPAMFVHPAEASHGDLGMITAQDVIIMLSNSGESAELGDMLAYSRRFSVPLIAITANAVSALGEAADVILELPKATEACPNGLAPTTSTLMQLALGDALAIALLEDKGFSAKDFRQFHPGGKLGAQLKHARDVMHKAGALPLVSESTLMSEALVVMSAKSFGCVGVVDAKGNLAGVVTDGDLRRHMSADLLQFPMTKIMTKNPRTIDPDALAGEVIDILNTAKITSIFVVEKGKPVGLIHIHDLLRIGVG